MSVILQVRDLSKQYRLGEIGTGTISHDLNKFIAKMKGKEDPYLVIGEENRRTIKGGKYVWALKNISFKINFIFIIKKTIPISLDLTHYVQSTGY